MKIEPYTKIDEVSLGVQERDLLSIFGKPERKEINSIGLIEMDYGSQVFRFESAGDLSEATIESETVDINGVSIPFTHLAAYIKSEDAEAFESVGFIVSPKFGLAFDPEYRPWITVLTKQGLAAWQKV